MYDLARHDGETAFIDACQISVPSLVNVCQSSEDEDMRCHFDVKILEYDQLLKTAAWHFVDVKDVEEKNFSTGKYSITKACIDFHKQHRPYGYYMAFRVIKNNMRTKQFVLASTQDILSLCKLDDRGAYSLVYLSEVMHKCSCRTVG